MKLQSNNNLNSLNVGIRFNDFETLRRYLSSALKRCNCELDEDRRDEIELFLIEKYWFKGKNIPTCTRQGEKDPAVKWALREKLRDALFQNHSISSIQNEEGEEIDVFETIGVNDEVYKKIEQWHDICVTVGDEAARALLFSFYDSEKKKYRRKK